MSKFYSFPKKIKIRKLSLNATNYTNIVESSRQYIRREINETSRNLRYNPSLTKQDEIKLLEKIKYFCEELK